VGAVNAISKIPRCFSSALSAFAELGLGAEVHAVSCVLGWREIV